MTNPHLKLGNDSSLFRKRDMSLRKEITYSLYPDSFLYLFTWSPKERCVVPLNHLGTQVKGREVDLEEWEQSRSINKSGITMEICPWTNWRCVSHSGRTSWDIKISVTLCLSVYSS